MFKVGKVRFKVYLEFIWRFGLLGVVLFLGGYSLAKLADFGSLLYIADFSKEIDGEFKLPSFRRKCTSERWSMDLWKRQ